MYIPKGVLVAFVVLSILPAYLVDRRAEATLAQAQKVRMELIELRDQSRNFKQDGIDALRALEQKNQAFYGDWGRYTKPGMKNGGGD